VKLPGEPGDTYAPYPLAFADEEDKQQQFLMLKVMDVNLFLH
jgi:hypothetical protein